MRKRILLVDTLNSCFFLKHAGETNVMWRFLNDIRAVADRFNAHRVIFAYEGKGGSRYRKELYPEYKWKRKELREKASEAEKKVMKVFLRSVDDLVKYAHMFGIKTVNVDGAEADDTIAYLINNIDLEKYQIMLLSSDTDLHQLIRPGVVQGTYGRELVTGIAKGSIPASMWLNFDQYCKEQGITPEDYAYAKALSGDTSDSIAGFDGIGEKTALALIKKYKTFKNIKQHIDTLSVPRLQKKSVEHMREDFGIADRNYLLISLNWDREQYVRILGEEGVDKLTTFISEIPTPPFVDKEGIKELCYEHGRVDIVDKLDFWLHAFSR